MLLLLDHVRPRLLISRTSSIISILRQLFKGLKWFVSRHVGLQIHLQAIFISLITLIIVDEADQVTENLDRHYVRVKAGWAEELLDLLVDYATNIYQLINLEINAPILNHIMALLLPQRAQFTRVTSRHSSNWAICFSDSGLRLQEDFIGWAIW